MRKFLTFLCCAILLFGRATAQDRTISGKVLDATGAPIAAASITVKESHQGTSTGADGSFSLSVAANAKTLIVSAVNYTLAEFNIQNKRDLGSLTLQTSNTSLNEVVVVAYGQTKKTNITGSVTTISGAAVADKPFSSVDKTLQGAVAGVQVSSTSGQPGSATDIRIRGIGSISASASPLWVIDGVAATTGDQSSNTTTSNVLATMNPDDIESITVLKDAASTAVYGSRASNGVILVTTKKGRAGKTRINLSAEVGQNSQAFNPNVKPVNSIQTQTLLRQGLINAGYVSTNAQADALIIDPTNGLGILPNYTSVNTNWHDVVSQNGPQGQYNISVAGGTDKTQIYASGGYFQQTGTTLASDFKRYNGSLSVTHKASDRFTISSVLNVGYTVQHTPSNGGTFANPVLASFFLLPWYTPYTPGGALRFGAADSLNEFPQGAGLFNPVVQADYNKNIYRQISLRGNVQGEYKILNNLKFTTRYAGEYSDISEDQYRNPFYGDGYAASAAAAGNAFSTYTRLYDWTWTNYLDFRQSLNKDQDFYFDVKPGYESYEFNKYNLQTGAQGFPQTLLLQYLTSAATPTTSFVLPTASSISSEFGLADINYKDRYVLTGSWRRDGSSVFGANHKYGSFYSVGGTWNINEEDFLKTSNLFTALKLRSSYGQTGNQQGFGLYTPLATYGYGNNYAGEPGSGPNNVGNPNLSWEKNSIFNVGVDFGVLKDRITGTFEWYDRKTTNLLLAVPLSLTSGFTTQTENVGGLSNKGIEVTLGFRPVVTRDFTWTINFNIAHNVNRVTALYRGQPIPSAQGEFQYTVGHDFLTYYLPQWAGVNEATGAPQWYTDNSSKKILTGSVDSANFTLNDKYSASPKIFGSFTNSFSYKGLTLDIQFNYNYGNYLYDTWGFINETEGAFLSAYNQQTRELQAWQKPGDKTDIPQIIFGGNNNSNAQSTRYLYKGDYMRLRNLQLNYSFPKSLLDKIHVASLSIYFRGTNLLTTGVDKNSPYDPESGIYSNTNLEIFIPKTVTGGIKLGF
jgi:TonB-linked SusC/RagA family outer membrane protein